MKLFISYSRDDKNFVYELVEKLRNEAGHYVWIDREILGGQHWWDGILDNIETCECFILVLTPRYTASVNCDAELKYAFALNKEILPIRLKPCTIPETLQTIQYINADSVSLSNILLQTIRALSNTEARFQKRGYTAQTHGPRPPLPVAKADASDNIYEIFKDAEVAAADNNIAKAEILFQKVMNIDPRGGLGIAAAEHLVQIRRRRDCAAGYLSIVQLVEKGLIPAAQAAWYSYVQTYGPDHDPNNYIALLSKVSPQHHLATSEPTLPHLNVQMSSQAQIEFQVQNVEHATPLHSVHTSVKNDPGIQEKPTLLVTSDEKPMRLIPASEFYFGNGEIRELPDFYIDSWPVTNEEYQRFVLESNINPPAQWRKGNFLEKKGKHPVTGINWYEAMAYANWAGKRLPTAAEWEKAARGTDGRNYPWGEGFDVQRCNTIESGKKGTTPVSQYQTGISIYGILDMAGNVWEWTSDEIKPRGMGRQAQETKRVLKGGSWNSPKGSAECAAFTSAWPHEQIENTGFRCALSRDKI
ncbi:MAG: hypothetical protein PVS3B3_25970 [Ktedonobacteraceae bacterium]